MADIDARKIKILRRGEIAGTAFTILSGLAVVYFAAMFIVGTARNDAALENLALYSGLPALAVFAAISAVCYLKFGVAMDREIVKYTLSVMIENAARLHPERSNLSFTVQTKGAVVEVAANKYNDKLVIDFTPFGKAGPARRAAYSDAVTDRITYTFLRLYDKGGDYKSVDFRIVSPDGRKYGKTVPVITDGKPDKNAYKDYLKNR